MKKMFLRNSLLCCAAAVALSSCSSGTDEDDIKDVINDVQVSIDNEIVEQEEEIVPIFVTASCGSIPETELDPGTTFGSSTNFLVDTLVGSRIGNGATGSNNTHHWSIDLEPGVYHLVMENSTISGANTNVGIRVQRLNASGVEVGQLINSNQIDYRIREDSTLVIENPTTVFLKITPKFGSEDYQMGVFRNETPVPSPFFSECPDIKNLALGVTEAFDLLRAGESGANEVWFQTDLEISDYTMTSSANLISGTSSNIIYSVVRYEQFGQASLQENVLRANEIDFSAITTGDIRLTEPGNYWIRFRNTQGDLSIQATLNED